MSNLDLIQGTLHVLVLRSLAGESRHGYQIARWVRERTGGDLRIEEGALYPALHRLIRRGWVAWEWGASENNRRAKFYRLTPKGRRQLQKEVERWRRYATAMGAVLAEDEA
jgi:transcriptional regulator